MAKHNAFRLLPLLFFVTSSMAGNCVPGHNCYMPYCRCWNDPTTPGGIPFNNTPQMVLLSFEYAVNSANVNHYSSLFENIDNPNKCPPTGTFFVQKNYTSPDAINYLYSKGHEIGVTSASGTVPADWAKSFKTVVQFLANSGIPLSKIGGSRAPQLLEGGDNQVNALTENRLVYDASCVTRQYTKPGDMLWPYTYDFVDLTPKCVQGSAPTLKHPGIWQFMMTALEFNSTLSCATPADCSPYLKSSTDTFDFLSKNFFKHYNLKRTPFHVFIPPQWLSVKYQTDGTMEFLQYIRASFKDTWIISYSQALEWMKNPVNSVNATKYGPWSC